MDSAANTVKRWRPLSMVGVPTPNYRWNYGCCRRTFL